MCSCEIWNLERIGAGAKRCKQSGWGRFLSSLCRNILVWMNNPPETISYAYDYIFIIFLGIPATILAILIAFSRLYLYVHYPTDVIFSLFAGILFAVLGNMIAQRINLPTIGKRGKFQA